MQSQPRRMAPPPSARAIAPSVSGLARFVLAVSLVASACGLAPAPVGPPQTPAGTSPVLASATAGPTVRPVPGHELYGYLPYWEMDDTIADHLVQTPLTTLALFSVTDTAKGALNTKQTGYQRITGEPGTRIIREAHARGTRVDLVFTSFGGARNQAFFASTPRQDSVIAALTALVGKLGLDGVGVDVEGLDPLLVPEFGAFVGRLRAAVVAADPGDRVTVATSGNTLGVAMAAAAITAGADRVFLMGYDYRVAGSAPGATAPLHSRDGDRDLSASTSLYAVAGIPADRVLLGLPLYGMSWPVAGPVIGAPQTGRGDAWIPRRHLDVMADPTIVPIRDTQEVVDVYLFASDGTVGPPQSNGSSGASPGASPPASPGASLPIIDRTWTAVYVDSPATLAPKLALANEMGYAGAGFWAIGYERGLPGYTKLMARFVSGAPLE